MPARHTPAVWFAIALGSGAVLAQAVEERLPIVQPRSYHAMVGDVGRVFLIGGVGNPNLTQFEGECHSLQGAQWTRVGEVFPSYGSSARVANAAFDPTRRTILVGVDFSSFRLYEWDGAATQAVTGPLSVFPYWTAGPVHVPARQACVLYGATNLPALNYLYEYSGNGWQQIWSGVGPQIWGDLLPQPGGDLLLVGSQGGASPLEVWRWSSGVWSALPVPPVQTTTPTGLALHTWCATHDPVSGTAIVGGYPTGSTAMQVYAFNGTNWNLIAAGGPDFGSGWQMAHDGSRLVFFGGRLLTPPSSDCLGETWTLTQGVFSRLLEAAPPFMNPVNACLDTQRQRTVLVGMGQGSAYGQQQTWEFDGKWFQHKATELVSTECALAFDRGRGVVVQYRPNGQTLEWDGAHWTTTVPAGGPFRTNAALAYDGTRLLRVGGMVGGVWRDETWAYLGSGWSQLSPTNTPGALRRPQLVEDRRRNVVVLVSDLSTTIHEWNGSTWTAVATAPWTTQSQYLLTAFHPARGSVVFGGGSTLNPPALRGDMWEWDGATFRALPPVWGRLYGQAVGMPDGDLLITGGLTGGSGSGWNWTHSALRSLHPAVVEHLGSGCAGSVGSSRLLVEPWQRPWLGDMFTVTCAPLAASTAAVLWVLGSSSQADPYGPLPRDLSPFGAPGCTQYASVDMFWAGTAVNAVATTSIDIPAVSVLLGWSSHLQAIVPDATNAAGFVVSDALTATLGQR